MKIVTTPMCEGIVKLAGITDYKVTKFPKKEDGDLAILLSESKTDMEAIYIKLNTFTQIKESFEKVKEICNGSGDIDFSKYLIYKNYLSDKNVKVKVYSNFIRDIVEDIGLTIDDNDYDYVIAPDYIIPEINEKKEIIEIPSHSNAPIDPIERAYMRYKTVEDFINNQH